MTTDIKTWLSTLYLCLMFCVLAFLRTSRLNSMHTATVGVAIACLACTSQDLARPESWFVIVKVSTLQISWLSLLLLGAFAASPIVRALPRILLIANVAEVALLAFQYHDVVVGVACLFLTPFSPIFYITENGKLVCEGFACVLGLPSKLQILVRWYFRAHYVFMAAFYSFAVGLSRYGGCGTLLLGAVVPFSGMELIDSSVTSLPEWFVVRVFFLVWGAWVYIFANQLFFDTVDDLFALHSYVDWLSDHKIARNMLQCAWILSILCGCAVRDRIKGSQSRSQTRVASLSSSCYDS